MYRGCHFLAPFVLSSSPQTYTTLFSHISYALFHKDCHNPLSSSASEVENMDYVLVPSVCVTVFDFSVVLFPHLYNEDNQMYMSD